MITLNQLLVFLRKHGLRVLERKAKLMIQPLLHDVTEKARAIKALVDMGVIKTLSVGFKPLESPDGITFTKNELLEVSMVNVPANADAMTLAYKSLKDSGFDNDVIKDVGIPVELLEKIDEVVDRSEKNGRRYRRIKNNGKSVKHCSIEKTNRGKTFYAKGSRQTQQINCWKQTRKSRDRSKKLIKVIKRANEILIVKEKDKLNGKNQLSCLKRKHLKQ